MLKSLFLFCLLPTITYAQTAPTQTIDHPEFTIQYPANWTNDQSGTIGTAVILYSPLEAADDKCRENVNVMIQNLTGLHIDLNKYVEISEGQIKTMVTNPQVIESKRVTGGIQEYHRMVYAGDQGILRLQFLQYYIVTDDKAYVLTFTTEQRKFDTYKNQAEEVLNSFRLKK